MKLSHLSEAANPKSSTFVNVDFEKLKPGKKADLKLKLAYNLQSKVSSEIYLLKSKLEKLNSLKDFPQASKVEGLIDNLKTLESNINEEIKKLTETMTPPAVAQLLTKISMECSEFIAEAKKANKWLYRGANGPSAFVGRSWDKRKTKDSSSDAQNFFDQYLAAQGFVALRGNSIFATSDIDHAVEFGDLFFIFPVNGRSEFTYTNQPDLTLNDVSEIPFKTKDKWKTFQKWLIKTKSKTTDKNQIKILDRLLDMESWYYDNPTGFIKTLNDPKVEALGLPPEFKNLTMTDLMDMDKFNKEFNPSRTELYKALYAEVEVYVHGVYYALSLDAYAPYVINLFEIPVEEGYY